MMYNFIFIKLSKGFADCHCDNLDFAPLLLKKEVLTNRELDEALKESEVITFIVFVRSF